VRTGALAENAELTLSLRSLRIVVWLLLLVASVGALVWAHVAIAVLSVCLNETPRLADSLQSAIPTSAATARGLLALVEQGVGEAGACDTAAPARAMAIGGIAYLVGVVALRSAGLSSPTQLFVIGAAAFVSHAALLFMPALLSSDILDYAAYGRVVAIHSANPYVSPPATFPNDPFAGYGAWQGVVTVYGPLWTRISAGIAALLPAGDAAQLAFAFKLVALVANAVNIGLIWWLARRWRSVGVTNTSAAEAVALYAWNPLVNVEVLGNAHNEAVMMTLVLLGFVLLTRAITPYREARQGTLWQAWLWLSAVGCMWLGALVKFVPAAAAAIVSFVWLARAQTTTLRLKRMLLVVSMLFALAIVVTWPWLDSPAVASPLLGVASGGQRIKDAWQDAAAEYLVVRLLPRLDVPDDLREDVARTMVWGVTRAIFAIYAAFEVWWLAKRAVGDPATALRAIAIASVRVLLMSVLLFVSQVYAWYFLWPLPIACVLGLREPWSRGAIVFGLTFLPAFYLREFESYGVFYLPIYALVALSILTLAWFYELIPNRATRA
jgi:alpha-1,6-mannosyltransferase